MTTNSTPTVDELRRRGDWSAALNEFAEWDPDWIERCARMVNNPWDTGILPAKWIELICLALNAASTHRNEPGVRRHIRAALRAGASKDEILETLKGVSVLGIHSVAIGLPILLEEAGAAGVRPANGPPDAVPTPVIDQLKAGGQFNSAWDAIFELDPVWLEQFLDMAGDLYSGVLPVKLVELMSVAVDASCTHLYTPGIRRHVQRSLALGVTIEELMEVLKLCGGLGADACELATPILAQELAEFESNQTA